MNIEKGHFKDSADKPSFVYQDAPAQPNVAAQGAPAAPGIPESLKNKGTEKAQEEAVVFDEKAKQETQKKPGFFGRLKATMFPAKKTAAPAPAGELHPAAPGQEPAPAVEGQKIDPKAEAQEIREAEKIYREGLATIKDLIAPSSMEFEYDKIRLNGTYGKTFFVYAYPRFIETNWLSPVVNFDVTMDISMFIYPTSSTAIMKFLKKKVAQIQSTMRIEQEKGMVADPAMETALQDAEELRRNIQRGEEKFFQYALYFTIYADDEEGLRKIQTRLESTLGGKMVLTKGADLQAEHGFNTSLPLALDELEVTRNMNTGPLSTTFPFTSSDLTSNEGILYGINRHNDSLIIFDRFALENANSVVFATSGAGKSYAVKLEILRSMMMGTDVIVIDPENEYEALANMVGGTYLKVSLNSDRRINPFDLPLALKDEEEKPGDLLRSNIITLHGLLNLMLGKLTPEEEGLMDKALIDTYSLKGITMETQSPGEMEPPTMEDLYEVLSSMKGGENLAQRLQKYTVGTFAGIFNKPTNVDLGTGMIVFCIRDLEDLLRPIAMYIILNYIWNRVRSSLKRRILVIDEAWSLVQYDDSARFLYGLVKRARKYYLGITTITQDVDDFIKSKYGHPIITNSSMQLLLKQAPSSVEGLAKIFNLTEGEKYLLLNSTIGQGLFFAGLKHVAIQIIASYAEDKVITTNPEALLKQQEGKEVGEAAPAVQAPAAPAESAEATSEGQKTPAEPELVGTDSGLRPAAPAAESAEAGKGMMAAPAEPPAPEIPAEPAVPPAPAEPVAEPAAAGEGTETSEGHETAPVEEPVPAQTPEATPATPAQPEPAPTPATTTPTEPMEAVPAEPAKTPETATPEAPADVPSATPTAEPAAEPAVAGEGTEASEGMEPAQDLGSGPDTLPEEPPQAQTPPAAKPAETDESPEPPTEPAPPAAPAA